MRGLRHIDRSRRRGDDRGSSAVELVLLTPALMLAVFVIVQAALYMHARHIVTAAAQHGARIARTTDTSTPVGIADARTATLDYLRTVGGDMTSRSEVSVSRDATTATVVVHADAISILPGLHLSVAASSRGPLEQFVPAAGGGR
jgi:Flp pilus assembly protein TadG